LDKEVTLINQDKIDEWIREVEQRPASAALIIQYIANRLAELSTREEELAAQNIELLSGRKVEEYENRIASLEYQLDLLKRQLGGEVILPAKAPDIKHPKTMLNLLVYTPLGQVLRVEVDPAGITTGQTIATISSDARLEDMLPEVLLTSSQEELLFLFDSGRTVSLPVAHLPLLNAGNLDWQMAFLQEPRVKEQLASICPIGRMSLHELCIQFSRRGFVKKTKTTYLASHITENYVGTGVKLPADKTCGLVFAGRDELFIMVSREGHIFSMRVDQLPVAIDEVLRLGITDHIVTAFVAGQKTSVIFITHNGKAVHRDIGWFEPAGSFNTKGQLLLSRERREAGVRIIGAGACDDHEWGAILHSDGRLTIHQLGELVAAGSVPSSQPDTTILGFSSFHLAVMEM
jgi:DNA gyrase/topoisomerase IV subunit A